MFTLPDNFGSHVVFFDVDETLVEWVTNTDPNAEEALIVDGVLLRPIETHVEALKKHKERKDQVIVWTQGGSKWAEAVVKALELEEFVDIAMAKPTLYYDDLDVSVWMPMRIYKPEEEIALPDQPYD